MKNKAEEILNLVKEAIATKQGNNKWVVLGELPQSDIAKFKNLLDIDFSGYKRIIDVSAIKHALKEHANLKDTDFCLIPLIIENPDMVGQGISEDSIVYKKIFHDEYFYIEYIRKGRKYLAMKTFYKRKNRFKE